MIHVTSELEAKKLSRFEWQLPKVVSVSNGVADPETTSRAMLSKDVANLVDGPPYVLFLGRLSWKKGLDRLLNAFALTNHAKLVIAGNDEEGLVPRLLQMVDDLKIGGRVHFLSRTILGADKEHLFAGAQIFILPSYSENLGNTVLEAMRRGLPVVVTHEVGAAEIVEEANGGIVVSGDANQLSEAISRLSENSALAQAMGKVGQRYVLEHYGWPHVAAQMEALYESLINDTKTKSPCSIESLH